MTRTILVAALLATAPAFAQWPDKPKTDTNPTTTAKPADKPAIDTTTPPPLPPPHHTAVRTSSEDDGSGFGFGVRGAWAKPQGGLTGDEDLGGPVNWQLPVWLEAGYHINRNMFVGAYGQYAFGFANCAAGQDCSNHAWRAGLEFLYTFMTGMVQPWAGLGVGYEWLSTSASGDDRSFKGLELLNVQLGVDLALGKMTLGPFVSYSLFGKYSSFDANGVSNDIGNSRGHNWFQAGLKLGVTL